MYSIEQGLVKSLYNYHDKEVYFAHPYTIIPEDYKLHQKMEDFVYDWDGYVGETLKETIKRFEKTAIVSKTVVFLSVKQEVKVELPKKEDSSKKPIKYLIRLPDELLKKHEHKNSKKRKPEEENNPNPRKK